MTVNLLRVILGHPGSSLGHPGVILGHPWVILAFFGGYPNNLGKLKLPLPFTTDGPKVENTEN